MKAPLCKLDDIPQSGTSKIDFFGREALVYRVAGQPESGTTVSGPAGTCPHALMLPTRIEDGAAHFVWGE